MAGEAPDWQGLLKWSLAHSDGTSAPRQLSEEDRKWFMEAMQSQTIDVVRRMKEITMVMNMTPEALQSQGVTVEDLEDLLEELQTHVESIDMANDLHSIGGLTPLLNYLKNPNPSIRARASEVVSTMVQNNPKCQQLVMDAKGLESLLHNFMSDPDTTVRTKSLGAISSLIRNNKPAITAFKLGNGYTGLKDAIVSDNARFQRKGLQVLQYLLHDNPNDKSVASELGFVHLLMSLIDACDADVRQAALQSLVEMAQDGKFSDHPEEEDNQHLKEVLQSQMDKIQKMNSEELGAITEERMLLDSLWQKCSDEPSSLRKNGLVVLPVDNEPPPDVASKFFEPALRAWAAPREPQPTERKPAPPLLLGSSSENSRR